MTQKKVLIVDGSPRLKGNTAFLMNRVADFLRKNKIEPDFVRATPLHSQNNGCIGCQACQKSKEYLCVFKDDVQPVVASMPSYNYVIFACPVYFYSPTAQLKLVIDRMYSLVKLDKDGNYISPFKGTKIGLLLTAGGDENDGADLVIEMFKRIAANINSPLETLLVTNTPFGPEELDDQDEWVKQAESFCQRLIG